MDRERKKERTRGDGLLRGGRRKATLALVALVLAGTVAGCASSTSSGGGGKGTVNVGMIAPLTGALAANGHNEINGFKLGLRDFTGAGQKVDGSKINVKYVDDQSDPTSGLSQARALLQNDGIQVLEGPLASNVIGAVAGYVEPQGVPTDDLSLCASIQLQDYQKYGAGLDSGWNCDQPAIVGGNWAAKTAHYKRIAVIGQDFSFGWEVLGGFEKGFEAAGGHITKQIWVPQDATDFSSYISQIPRNVDAVYAEMSGSAAVRFTQAYQQFGLKKIPLLGIVQLTDYSVLPAESASAVLGVHTDAQYCDGINTPQNKKFTTEYYKQYHTYPGYYSEAGYTKAEILASALKRLHGNASDHKKMIAAMKSVNIQAPRGPVKLNPKYSTVVQNEYICKVERVDGHLRNVPVKTYPSQEPWATLPQSTWLAHFKHDSAARPAP